MSYTQATTYVRCPSCKGQLGVPANSQTTSGPCPHCGAPIRFDQLRRRSGEAADRRGRASGVGNERIRPEQEKDASSFSYFTWPLPAIYLIGAILVIGAILLLSKWFGGGEIPSEDQDKTEVPAVAASVPEPVSALEPKEPNPPQETIPLESTTASTATTADSVNQEPLPDEAPLTPEAALEYFLDAKSAAAIADGAIRSSALKPAIEDYYADAPVESLRYGLADFHRLKMPAPGNSNLACFLVVDEGGDSGVSDAVFYLRKDPEDGVYRYDWETFVQSRDQSLLRFIRSPAPGVSGVFRIDLRRQLPELDDGKVVQIQIKPPISNRWVDTCYFQAPDESDLGKAVRKNLALDAAVTATVIMGWGWQEEPVLEIRELVCWQYFGLGTDERIGVTGEPFIGKFSKEKLNN